MRQAALDQGHVDAWRAFANSDEMADGEWRARPLECAVAVRHVRMCSFAISSFLLQRPAELVHQALPRIHVSRACLAPRTPATKLTYCTPLPRLCTKLTARQRPQEGPRPTPAQSCVCVLGRQQTPFLQPMKAESALAASPLLVKSPGTAR
jgi:hypothetical protein